MDTRRRGVLGSIAGRRATVFAGLLMAGALAGCGSTSPGAAYQPAQPAATRTSSATHTLSAQPALAASPLAGLHASGVLGTALSTMKAAVSVHVNIRQVQQSRTAVYSDDSADGAGRQEIMISGEHAIVLVVGKVTYVQGNVAALTGIFGFPAAAAARLVNRWISFRPGDTGYQQVTSGVTLGGLVSELELTGPLTIKTPGRSTLKWPHCSSLIWPHPGVRAAGW